MKKVCDKKLGSFLTFLNYKNYSQKTINNYIFCVKNTCKIVSTPPSQLTAKTVDIFLYNFKFSSISQQNVYISALKLFLKNILNIQLNTINLERPRKEKHLPRVIDSETLIQKINQIQNIKHKTILSLAYSTGMRVSEIINLKIEDVDSKRMLIKIINGKGKKDRFVPLSKNILNSLREYYKQYKPKIYLFNGQNCQQYSISSCQKIYKTYIDKVSSFHCLRHSAATKILENGTDIHIIQKLLGHKNVKTTEIYTHVSNELLSKINLPM